MNDQRNFNEEQKKEISAKEVIENFGDILISYDSAEEFAREYRDGTSEDIIKIKEYAQFLTEKGMLYTRGKNGLWRPMKNADELADDDLSEMIIRTDSKAAPYLVNKMETGNYEMSKKPITDPDIITALVSRQYPPEKPNSWGIFQFLKTAANAINKAFGGQGFKEYREYEEKRREFDITRYYSLKAAGYNPKKPDSVKAEEREYAVKKYIQLQSEEIINSHKNNLDFYGQSDPLESADAMDRIRDNMLKSPQLDEFINNPATQSFLVSSRMSNLLYNIENIEPSVEQDQKFTEAGKKITNEAVNNFLAEELHKRVMKRSEEEKQKSAEEKVLDSIKKNSANISAEVGKMLDKNIPENERQAFTDELISCMAKDTPEAWGIRHFIQESVRNNGDELMNKLCDDFNANRNGKLDDILTGMVNPEKDNFYAAQQYREYMSGNLLDRQQHIWKSVEDRINKPSDTVREHSNVTESPVNKYDGPAKI